MPFTVISSRTYSPDRVVHRFIGAGKAGIGPRLVGIDRRRAFGNRPLTTHTDVLVTFALVPQSVNGTTGHPEKIQKSELEDQKSELDILDDFLK